MTNENPKDETNRPSSVDFSRSAPNATVTLFKEQGCEAVCPSNRQPSVQQSMAGAAVTHQTPEPESLIHELSAIRQQIVNDGRIVQRAAVEKCGAEVGKGLSLNQGVGAFQ
ncbi:hypothetical protein ETAA8_44060 [Anatilimnocola aggregata]|uniref:Uncharacterized protein n=1 Tax=Anatilimnocola aggregata TaxID=2528021 RepID=A0A517YGE3_9BACT|nr:hypothetical protein [Anatilimnocola aggregata]QDU29298.1 hypothetical protein ETAA8_44060 [Anatilimnocola aggregata]